MSYRVKKLGWDFTCSARELVGGSAVKNDISASVGLGGVNLEADVRTVQRLLNGAPPSQGGPVPKLEEDGKVGQLTVNAIAAFQKKQIGWSDGRVDPGGQTLRRLQAIAEMSPDNPTLAPSAVASIPDALQVITMARVHLQAARLAFSGGPGGEIFAATNAAAAALVNKHFHLDKAQSPLSALDMVDRIYSRMQVAIGHVPAGSWVFEDDPSDPPDTAYAFTYMGGYFFLTGQSQRSRTGRIYLDRIYLCRRLVSYDSQAIVYAMVHELAHFCGGREGMGDAIDDWAYAHRPTGYETLAPYSAIRNADCYAQYAWEAARHVAFRPGAHTV
jgi:hypothetical protein